MPDGDTAPAAETGDRVPLLPPGEGTIPSRGAFRALRHRNYRLYFFGQLTSLAGTWMQSAAQAWLVLKLTNSSTMLGVVSFAQFTPILLVGLFAGVIVDRLDRRRLIITTQILLMLSAFTLAALTWSGAVRVEYVIILAAFNGTVSSFDMPGRQSFVVEMVGYEDLANAIALNSMMFNTARMLGPAAAGLLIAWLGIGTCFFLNGVSFLAVIWSLTQMEIPARVIAGAGARMLHQLREGLAYVWSNRPIFYQMALAAVTNGFGYTYLVLVPLFARNVLHGDARTYGFLVAIQGLGSVVGAATLASRVTTRGIRNNLIAGLFLSAAGIVVFGLSRSIALSMAAQFVIGAGLTNFRASNNTLVQMFVSDDLRGRVMSTYQLATVGMAPIGALEVGYMGSHLGPMQAVVICGAVTMISGIVLLTRLKSIGKDAAPS
ncbi:MAG: MFS transporter [Candidatus Binatus sp.]|uniref:MFS transporter n=1 Tax=Candidatus Binatus sp. TaxID=2811406 RepID=UPI003C76A960